MLNVQDITNSALLKTANILTGKNKIATKAVEWVSVIESPVENFVRENEFVLSTGIGCHEDMDALMEFVKDVYNSGASALAFATGRYIFDIPKEVIEFARKNEFIMIEIPWEIRFADIVHEVMNKINQLQQQDLQRARDIQQQLLQMLLEGKSLVHIANYIEKELKQSVLIFNSDGEVMAGSANDQKVVAIWNKLKETVENDESHHPLHSKMKKFIQGNDKLLHLPIISNGSYKGDFFILSNASIQLRQQEINIVEQAIMTAALWFSRNKVVTTTEMRLENDFILRLADGEKMSDEHVQTRAELFGIHLQTHYECIVGLPENLDSFLKQGLHPSNSKQRGLERMMTYIKEEMLNAAKAVQREILFAYKDDQLIIFLETANECTTDTVNHFLDLVERRFSHLLPGVQFSWGIGKSRDGTAEFHQSYQKAKAALDMGRTQKGIGKRINFNETKMNRLLLNLAINEEVQDITLSTISALIDYNEKRDLDLINTFIAYNKNSGNVSQTARELNLHRQSLLYRLRKIESLTGLSLINPDDLFLLDFSIKIWSTGIMHRNNKNAAML